MNEHNSTLKKNVPLTQIILVKPRRDLKSLERLNNLEPVLSNKKSHSKNSRSSTSPF